MLRQLIWSLRLLLSLAGWSLAALFRFGSKADT